MSKFIRAISAFTYLALLVVIPVAFESPANAVAPQSTDFVVYLTAYENYNIDYVAPDGYVIKSIDFASYGTPENYQTGWCHAANSQSIIEKYITPTVLSITAGNWLFGDPCGGTYKKLSVVLTITQITPEIPKRLNAPINLSAKYVGEDLLLTWDKPEPTNIAIERYAIMWSVNQDGGSAVSSTTNSITLPEILFAQTYGFDTLYTFTVRADNDTLRIYSNNSESIQVFISSPKPTPSPTVEPSPTPTPTIEPSASPTPTPTKEPEPQPSKSPTLEPSPKPVVTSSPEPTPIAEPTVEPTVEPTITTEEEVVTLSNDLQADGNFSEEDKQLVADVLTSAYEDSAIPADVFAESGLDYSDLPPEQPITLDNGVVITANVADALQIFEAPSEILSAVFTDPSKALTAIANVGADMTKETRKKVQQAAVPAVIVTQVISGTASLLTRKI